MDKLRVYRDKRDPARTPEPVPAQTAQAEPGEDHDGGTFVIQEHHARRLHWDFRLERVVSINTSGASGQVPSECG